MHLVRVGSEFFNLDRLVSARFIPEDEERAVAARLFLDFIDTDGFSLHGEKAEALHEQLLAAAAISEISLPLGPLWAAAAALQRRVDHLERELDRHLNPPEVR